MCSRLNRYFSYCFLLLLGGCLLTQMRSHAELQSTSPTPTAYGSGFHNLKSMIENAEGHVVLPAGTYPVEETIEIDLSKTGPFSLQGHGRAIIVKTTPGPAIRIKGSHYKSADPKGFEDLVWERERMPLIDGIAITGSDPAADGIVATGTMQLTITRTHIRKVRHAIRLVENNRNVIVSDCHLYENSGIGLFLDDVNLHQINVSNCHISYNDQGGIVSRAGNVRNLHITGCDLESNMSPETEPTANVLIDCRGGNGGTAEVAITGCTIQHNSPSPQSANIRMIGNSEPTAKLKRIREGHVTMTGNILSDVQTNIHLKECRGVTITGNTFWMGYEHDLLVENCSHIIVGPNNMDRNPRYAYGNALEAHNRVIFHGCDDSTITGLHMADVHEGEAGLLIEDCHRMHVTGCTILDCGPVGLLLKNVSDSLVSNCLINDQREGATSVPFLEEGGSNNRIEL